MLQAEEKIVYLVEINSVDIYFEFLEHAQSFFQQVVKMPYINIGNDYTVGPNKLFYLDKPMEISMKRIKVSLYENKQAAEFAKIQQQPKE